MFAETTVEPNARRSCVNRLSDMGHWSLSIYTGLVLEHDLRKLIPDLLVSGTVGAFAAVNEGLHIPTFQDFVPFASYTKYSFGKKYDL